MTLRAIEFKVEGTAPENFIVPIDKALYIVLVLLEAVNNAIKHSGAASITATTEYYGNKWIITIKDDAERG